MARLTPVEIFGVFGLAIVVGAIVGLVIFWSPRPTVTLEDFARRYDIVDS